MFKVFDEVYDEDANIYGTIISIVDEKHYVLWKNEVVGHFVPSKAGEIQATGRNFKDVALKDVIEKLQENPLLKA